MNKADKLLEDLREVDLFNVDSVNYGNRKHYIDQLESVVRQQQAEIEAVKKSNKNLMELVAMLREELDKTRQEVLMWENAEVPPETMADIIEELERRGFITK